PTRGGCCQQSPERFSPRSTCCASSNRSSGDPRRRISLTWRTRGAGVGRAGDPRRSDRPVRSRPGPGPRPGRHRHRPPAGPARGAMIAFALEIGVGALMLLVFVATLLARGDDRRWIGWLAAAGTLALTLLALPLSPAPAQLGGAFVQDGLALFAKRLFLAATFIGLLGGLSLPGRPFLRRAGEYHVLVLASLLGMLVLASARDLVLLFVAFELMSIPLYVLAGFAKREARAAEAALKFFLVGSVSSAVMAYGLSFVYGAAHSTSLAAAAKAVTDADGLLLLGLLAVFGG